MQAWFSALWALSLIPLAQAECQSKYLFIYEKKLKHEACMLKNKILPLAFSNNKYLNIPLAGYAEVVEQISIIFTYLILINEMP